MHLFARMFPDDKLRIINALKEQKEVVEMFKTRRKKRKTTES